MSCWCTLGAAPTPGLGLLFCCYYCMQQLGLFAVCSDKPDTSMDGHVQFGATPEFLQRDAMPFKCLQDAVQTRADSRIDRVKQICIGHTTLAFLLSAFLHCRKMYKRSRRFNRGADLTKPARRLLTNAEIRH